MRTVSSLLGFALAACLLTACSTTKSTSHAPEQLSEIVGVWKYKTSGSPDLDDGTLQITVNEGRLRGTLRDRQRGMVEARVRMHGNRVDIRLHDLHLSGRVQDGTFQAFLRRPIWDVSTSQDVASRNANRYRSRFPSSSHATFVAQRVNVFQMTPSARTRHCTPVLEETTYRCTGRLLP